MPAPTAYHLPRLPYLRLPCALQAQEPARLPPYHGSLLRGAFGHALRRSVCTMGPEQPCATCRLRRACVHTRLFETFIEEEPPPFLKGLVTPPRPYVFEPGGEREAFAAGDELRFDLVLVGRAVELAPYALLAVERMAAAGLGSRRARFGVAGGGAAAGMPGVEWIGGGGEEAGDGGGGGGAGAERAVVRFLTPARLTVGGKVAGGVGFRDLAFAMVRRALELAHFYAPEAAIDWEFGRLLGRCESVRVAASDLRWRELERYSNRQGRKTPLGGFVGNVTLAGELGPFVPLLRVAEVLHVGKGATFGLGRVAVEVG